MPLRKPKWDDATVGESPLGAGVRGESIQGILDVGTEGGPNDLLDAATRQLTELLGERGSWTLLGERPRSIGLSSDPETGGLSAKLDHYEEIAEAARAGAIVTLADGRSVAVPLSDGGCCVGVVVVTSEHPRPVSDTAR